MADAAKKLWELMVIDNNDFIRTTESRHTKVVEDIFDKFDVDINLEKIIFLKFKTNNFSSLRPKLLTKEKKYGRIVHGQAGIVNFFRSSENVRQIKNIFSKFGGTLLWQT